MQRERSVYACMRVCEGEREREREKGEQDIPVM
jgi:hypothetical protein